MDRQNMLDRRKIEPFGGTSMKVFLHSLAVLCFMAPAGFADAIDVYRDPGNGQAVSPSVVSSAGGYFATSWIFGEVDALPSYAGVPMYENGFGVTNTGANSFDASIFAGIWAADGPGGGPGTLLNIANSNPVTLPVGSFSFFMYSDFPIPSGNFWMGFAINNAFSPATTAADLSGLEFRVAGAPTVGTTSHTAMLGSDVGFLGSNPNISTTLTTNNSQFIQVLTPEPTTVEFLLGGLLIVGGLLRRRSAAR
jgi:hypothetical protein